VLALGWFTHIERGANSPGVNPWIPHLLDRHRVILYDGRGTGLSDRGIEDFSLDAKLRDLEAVVEAAGLGHFALYAISAGGPTAIAYTARHPGRVTRLALYGSFVSLDCRPGDLERWGSLVPAVRAGWGEDNPAFRQVFTSLFMPDGDEVSMRMFNEYQRLSATPEDAARFIESLLDTDVTDAARTIRVPVLVTHLRGDEIVPYECGREIAALVPGAKLHTIEGRNHAMITRQPVEELQRVTGEFFAAGLQEAASVRRPDPGSSNLREPR
jgi:pimeloyl-ACP methyl ester carboxylesterase